MLKTKFFKFLRSVSFALAALITFGACSPGTNPSPEEDARLEYDTRGLTPQEYSIANLTATDDFGRMITVADPTDSGKKICRVILLYMARFARDDRYIRCFKIGKSRRRLSVI